MADKQISNPNGAFGFSDLQSQLWNSQGTFKTSAVVTAKRCVAIGTDGSVAHAATNGTAALQLGIAASSTNTSGSINVVMGGIVTGVPVAGTVAAGDILKRSVTTTGFLSATATPGVGESIGVALAASASNTASVWVLKGV